MPQTFKLTRQGVRDLNDLGGKRVNGKRHDCLHFPEDVFVSDRIERRGKDGVTYVVNVLACAACERILGPEDEVEAQS